MKYLIIGAGGTGGCIGAYMTEAGKDVTMIARGAHLKAMQEHGLRMETTKRGNYVVNPVKACDMEHYNEQPDVIMVCVKGYSLDETIPFIQRVACPGTVVIPILNIYGTGSRMQKLLPEQIVTDGCIYVAGEIKEPGCLWMNGDILRIVYGVREKSQEVPALEEIRQDLIDSDIEPLLSHDIKKDTMRKYAYISAAASTGQYFDANVGEFQKQGEVRDTYKALLGEIAQLSEAMGIHFDHDIVKENMDITDALAPSASTSMQRDIRAGKNSEMDGLIFQVVRMGDEYGVELPTYRKIARAFGYDC
jgi:2-dehydropantoate 2-reductase